PAGGLEDLNVDNEFEGTVKRVANIGMYVDIGAEKDALLPSMMIPKGTKYKVGDKISGLTITEVQTGGTPATRKICLNVKAAPLKVGEGEIIQGTCEGTTKKGDKVELRVVQIDGNKITVSLDLEPKAAGIKIEDLVEGQKVQGTVIRVNPQFGLFMDIGSERDALYRTNQSEKPISEYAEGEKEVEVSEKQMPSECKVGEVLEGTVESITEFGVLFDARLTVSVLCPRSVLGKQASEHTVGEAADLTIMTIEAATNRISVSTQAGAPISDFPRGAQPLSEDNKGDEITNLFVVTSDAARCQLEVSSIEVLNSQQEDETMSLSELKVGDTVEGKVSRVMDSGVFVDVGAKRDALYSVSELVKPIDQFKRGQEMTGLKIIQADPSRQRLAVSSRKLAGGFSDGEVIDGKVEKVMNFGAFIEIGSGSGVKIGNLKGQQLKETVRAHKEYGAFVAIGLGRKEGLLPASFVTAREGMSMEALEIGDSLDVYIARLDVDKKKVTLSLTEPSEDSVVAP
ncbi:unnamed protein product, partial [Prorocentrum cordatum]